MRTFPTRSRRASGARAHGLAAVPGAAAAVSNAGPSLEGFSRRSYIAGRIPNLADPLTRWLMDPPAMKPGTMMPNLKVSESEARHMAAYLYTLR